MNEEFPIEYNSVQWTSTSRKSLIIHRLSVKAECQGKGIGKLLIDFVEDFWRKNGYSSIRQDAFTSNPNALQLYQTLGCTITGSVMFRKGEFKCFEKVLLCPETSNEFIYG
jgi:GNAT superfamily N-acetyltransferase